MEGEKEIASEGKRIDRERDGEGGGETDLRTDRQREGVGVGEVDNYKRILNQKRISELIGLIIASKVAIMVVEGYIDYSN